MKQFLASIFLLVSMINAQVTGLSDWDLFVDPGHSQTANMGVSGYSEAESNLTMALHLKDIFLSHTDISDVWTSRSNHTEIVGLSARSTMANTLDATWFHSIHSNAPASIPANNNVLLLYGESSPGVEKTWAPGGRAVSDIMAPVMAATMRIPEFGGHGSRGDCVFYGVSTGPYLSVNRNTNMPSELSESGFHTIPSHNQLQMNSEYARLVAHSMFWTFLDYHNIERPYPGILSGIITDSESDVPVNGATISINGQSYTTDSYESLFHLYSGNPDAYHNGFYFFEGLPDSTFEVIVSAEGFYTDTLQVSQMSPNFVTFLDILLAPSTPPYVVETNLITEDPVFPAWRNPSITFSRAMDEASIEAAFTIEPYSAGAFYFTSDQKRMSYLVDDTLEYLTDYTITIAGTATDVLGHPLDGNHDLVGGDDWSAQFTTGPPDLSPPFVMASYPINGSNAVNLRPVINLVWNEELDSSSVNADRVIFERVNGLQPQDFILEHHVINAKSVLVVYSMNDLLDVEAYRIRLLPGFRDLYGNSRQLETVMNFNTLNFDYAISYIDNFENNAANNWWQISGSGSNAGILAEQCVRNIVTDLSILSWGDSTSLRLDYGWDTAADSWLIREYLGGGAPRNVHFTASKVMQAFVFGDGKSNKFRFCVDDNISGGGAHEVSPWYTVNWYGWKLVSWDMSVDGTGTWIGDGNLDGTLEFDSIQLSYTPGQPHLGTYFVDELRVVDRNYLGVAELGLQHPDVFALLPNYPNPFNPWTTIPFTLATDSDVSIRVFNLKGELVAALLNGPMRAGQHATRWNAEQMSSGVYLLKMDANDISITRKVTVLK